MSDSGDESVSLENDDFEEEDEDEQPLHDVDEEVPQAMDEDISSRVMTRFEYVRSVGMRAKHLSFGASSNVVGADMYEIAKTELERGLMPLTIYRQVAQKRESFDVNALKPHVHISRIFQEI